MSDWETRDADAKREAYYDRHPEELPDALEPCRNGHQEWFVAERTRYGEDPPYGPANGSVPLLLYECRQCGDETEVRG